MINERHKQHKTDTFPKKSYLRYTKFYCTYINRSIKNITRSSYTLNRLSEGISEWLCCEYTVKTELVKTNKQCTNIKIQNIKSLKTGLLDLMFVLTISTCYRSPHTCMSMMLGNQTNAQDTHYNTYKSGKLY